MTTEHVRLLFYMYILLKYWYQILQKLFYLWAVLPQQ